MTPGVTRARLSLSLLLASLALAPLSGVSSAAQASDRSDLDALMERVLAQRDQNWKKLQQYVLSEREQFDLTGPDGARLYGFERAYTWFMRAGVFIRSPLRGDGVAIGEPERQRYEREWQDREERREKRLQARSAAQEPSDTADDAGTVPAETSDVLSGGLEPRFISAAYFLRFQLDPGQYALVGRERLLDRDVLRIEYYPTRLFSEGRTRPNRRMTERDKAIQEKLNKVSLVTLWIDPEAHQVLRYTFDDVDMDFLPARWLLRVNDLQASMQMDQPFPNVWLPRTLEVTFRATLAVGAVAGRYAVEYHDYKVAEVTVKVP